MLKRRALAVEKRLAALAAKRGEKRPQLVFCFGDGTEVPGEKDEARDEENGLIIFRMSRPRPPEGERVLSLDFGSGEGQTGQAIPKTMDTATDNNRPPEGEKK